MHRKVPAEKAKAPAVQEEAVLEWIPPKPNAKKTAPAGIISPKPILTSKADQRVEPARNMSDVIVKASAGLCTRVAIKTPRPALPNPVRNS